MYHITCPLKLHSDDLKAVIDASYDERLSIVEHIFSAIDKHPKFEVVGVGSMRNVEIYHLLRKKRRQLCDASLVER